MKKLPKNLRSCFKKLEEMENGFPCQEFKNELRALRSSRMYPEDVLKLVNKYWPAHRKIKDSPLMKALR